MNNNETKTDKTIKRVVTTFLTLVILTITFFGGYYTYYLTLDDDVKTFKWVMDSIKKYYYEEITDEELLNTALSAISYNLLDAYSTYYTAEDYALIQAQKEGNRVGVGISFMTDSEGKGTNKILKVNGNSPAEKAGIKAGQTISKIGNSLTNLTTVNNYEDVVNGFSNFKENEIFYIQTSDSTVPVSISKQVYTESYVYYKTAEGNYGFFTNDSGTMVFTENVYDTVKITGLASDTAYIKYTSFNGNSSEQFAAALSKFKSDGKTKLILDLRSNGGGYMDILQEISAHLVYKPDTKLVSAIAKFKNGSQVSYNINSSYYEDYNFQEIAVLGNAYTASASECLIGAMLDYGTVSPENVIVSRFTGNEGYTYGKGIMQNTFNNNFSDNALKLTVAHIYWPLSDTCIHGIGITGTVVDTSSGEIVSSGIDNELARAIINLND
jgi:carboxyl-terminal processing protease